MVLLQSERESPVLVLHPLLPPVRNTLLPAMIPGLYGSGIVARFLRASLVAGLRSDHVRTARAKGLKENSVILDHVMRNALLSFITVVGIMLAGFVGRAVVQGCILVVLIGYSLANLVVDALYASIDPCPDDA